jgi:hypothetical protein
MALTRRHLDVGLFGLLLLLGAMVVRGWVREGAEVPPSAAAARANASFVPLANPLAAPARTGVDLLARIDIDRDRVVGAWTRNDRGLRSPADKGARLQLPCLPPEEYDLRLSVTRLDHTDCLALGLVVDGTRAQVVLDGDGGRGSWIEVKDGAHGISANGITYFAGPVFANDRPAEVAVFVRKGRFEVRVDGYQILVWHGPPSRLFIGENWDTPDARRPFVGAWDSVFTISRIEIASVTGAVDFLR